MGQIFTTMFTFLTYKLWPGLNQIVQVRQLYFYFLGPAPSPRKGHCAILIGSNLVIHGGFYFNTEEMKKAGSKQYGTAMQNCYLNDIRVLDTENYVWSRLRVSGTPPEHRFDHTMDVSGSDIVMFGGWTKTSGSRFKHEPTEE